MKIHPRHIKIMKAVLLVSMLVLLWQFVRRIDPDEVQAALVQVGAGFGWVIASTFAAYALGTWGWWYCLGEAKNGVPAGRLFMIRHVCEMVGLFNPTSIAGGDMLKVALLRPYPINPSTVITSVIISRLLMVVSQACLLMVALGWFFLNDQMEVPDWKSGYLLGFIFLTGGIVCGFFYGLKKIRRAQWERYISQRPVLTKIWTKSIEIWSELGRFRRQHPKELGLAFVLFALHWMVGSLEFYIVLKLFGYDISLVDGLLLDMGVIAVKAAGAFVPGQIGVEELGNKIMLSLIGIASIPLWISVSALRRTRQVFWILVGVSFYVILVHKKKVYS